MKQNLERFKVEAAHADAVKAMHENNEKKDQRISGIVTTLIVLLLLLLFFSISVDYEVQPLPQAAEVEVEILEPESAGGGSPSSSSSSTSVPSMSIPSEEQTHDETAAPVRQTPQTPSVNPTPKPTEEFNISGAYKGGGAKGGGGGSDPDFGDGDGGSGGGKNGGHGPGVGSQSGAGFSHSFGTRGLSHPTLTHDCQISGKIILDIAVSPDGSIRILGTDPESTPSNCLEAKAISMVRNSKFAATNSNKEVIGTITVKFALN